MRSARFREVVPHPYTAGRARASRTAQSHQIGAGTVPDRRRLYMSYNRLTTLLAASA